MKYYVTLILSLLLALPAWPCSTVAKPGARYMGKNYDWSQTLGRLYVNKSGVKKKALVFSPADHPAEWTSKYGSLTFNQYGREFPNGGMNEAGLAIEIMWLTSSVYPAPDQRETVNELQWIQYMLDNYDSVAAMAADAEKLRVSMVTAPVHYLACDAGGECGTFENIGGKMVVHTGADLPFPSLTNDTYADSLAFLRQHIGFGGSLPIPLDTSSLSRFVRGTALAQMLTDVRTKEQMFALLDAVAQSNTVWQITYNIPDRVVHFRTSGHRAVKSVDLRALDFDCRTPVRSVDMQLAGGGLITEEMRDDTGLENQALVQEAIMGLPIDLPEAQRQFLIAAVSHYPSTTVCTK